MVAEPIPAAAENVWEANASDVADALVGPAETLAALTRARD